MRKSAPGLILFLVWGLLAPPVPAQTPARALLPSQTGASRAALPLETALISYDGFVEVQRAGQQNRQQVRSAPLLLEQGDRVHTFRQGEAVIQFRDGSRVTLSPYTIFTVEVETPSGITLNLALGRLRALVSRIRSREFRVRTSVAVASVRGTEFEVEALGERKSNVAVHEGSVAVANVRGDEILLTANQRINVFEDRLGRVEFFQGRPERGPDRLKPLDRKKEDRRRAEERRDERRDERGRMREALEREVGFQQSRDALESRAAFEQKSAVYQEGKTLIDAFGKRVRVEEYMLRPTPDSFKFVTLNFRDQRLDKSTFEVTANGLPKDLKEAGDLWFAPVANKPLFYALKQRWSVTNGLDSLTRIDVDGDSLPIQVPGQPVFDPATGTFLSGPGVAHQTVFGHRYEFINGGAPALDAIYFGPPTPVGGASRPLDLPSMMWHQVPIKVDVYTAAGNVFKASYFDYAFRTVSGAAGAVGKMYIDSNLPAEPGLAHFRERRNYFYFVDAGGTGGNGILDFPENSHPGDIYGVAGGCVAGTGPGCVYDDQASIGTWDAAANGGKGGLDFGSGTSVPLLGAASQQLSPTASDNQFFVDRVGNNQSPSDEAPLDKFSNLLGPKAPGFITFASLRSIDFTVSENFVIDDFGHVQNAPDISPAQGVQQNQVGQLFQAFNFERTIASNRFAGRKIDLVMNPTIFLQSGQLSAQQNHEGAPAPGGDPPGGP